MSGSEPINLTEWRLQEAQGGRLFSCGRPGRATFGREKVRVDDSTIEQWINGLPGAPVLHLVSLLGKKKSGFSEFGYYPFRSTHEAGTQPTLQEWLTERHGRRFVVHEFPTVDAQGIPSDTLDEVTHCVRQLLAQGNTVVVIDSAGAERTSRVCERLGKKRRS